MTMRYHRPRGSDKHLAKPSSHNCISY